MFWCFTVATQPKEKSDSANIYQDSLLTKPLPLFIYQLHHFTQWHATLWYKRYKKSPQVASCRTLSSHNLRQYSLLQFCKEINLCLRESVGKISFSTLKVPSLTGSFASVGQWRFRRDIVFRRTVFLCGNWFQTSPFYVVCFRKFVLCPVLCPFPFSSCHEGAAEPPGIVARDKEFSLSRRHFLAHANVKPETKPFNSITNLFLCKLDRKSVV